MRSRLLILLLALAVALPLSASASDITPPRLVSGNWTGTASSAAVLTRSSGVWTGAFFAQMFLQVIDDYVAGPFTTTSSGQLVFSTQDGSGRIDVTTFGQGLVQGIEGAPSVMTATGGATSAGTGFFESSQGVQEFPVSGTSPLGTITITIDRATCFDASATWRQSLTQVLGEVGWSADITALVWFARDPASEDVSLLGDLEQLVKDWTDHQENGFAAFDSGSFLSLLTDAVSIHNRLRNATLADLECLRAALGRGGETFMYVPTVVIRDLILGVGAATPPLDAASLANLATAGLVTGAIGSGSSGGGTAAEGALQLEVESRLESSSSGDCAPCWEKEGSDDARLFGLAQQMGWDLTIGGATRSAADWWSDAGTTR